MERLGLGYCVKYESKHHALNYNRHSAVYSS